MTCSVSLSIYISYTNPSDQPQSFQRIHEKSEIELLGFYLFYLTLLIDYRTTLSRGAPILQGPYSHCLENAVTLHACQIL